MFDVLYVGCVHVQSPPMHLRPFIVSLKVFFKCVKCVLPHCVYEYVHARAQLGIIKVFIDVCDYKFQAPG